MKWWLAITLAFLAGCGKEEKPKAPDVDLSVLLPKFHDYKLWNDALLAGEQGWTGDDCDATMKTSLLATLTDADPTLAVHAPGAWWRRRVSKGNCFPSESASESSRDMAVAEADWMALKKRSDLARDMMDYIDAHHGTLGAGDIFRTEAGAPLYATLCKIAGRKLPLQCDIPVTVGGEADGPARQVAAWHLLARADATNDTIGSGYNDWISARAREQPQNLLFQLLAAQYVTGHWQSFVDAALDERYYPRLHLPTSNEVCDDWPLQRDMGKDWQPCPQDAGHPFKQYSGSDWLTVVGRALRLAGLL
jgi:hypothetical protein